MDVLADVLRSLRLQSSLYCRSELAAPWGLAFVQHSSAVFHVVDRGTCQLAVAGEAPVVLQPGDLVVLPHGTAHVVSDAPDSPCYPPIHMTYDAYRACQIWHPQGPGEVTRLLCGTFAFAHPTLHPLLMLLPRMIHVSDAALRDPWLAATLRWMADEAGSGQPGAEAMLHRLADILLIQVIRYWIVAQDAGQGWLAALRDPLVGRALALIHADPGREWSVAALAEAVALSRSAFAARFTALVGQPPLAYLTRWRMTLAAEQLRSGASSVAQIAAQIGYGSETAFRRAFLRETGTTPGVARQTSGGHR